MTLNLHCQCGKQLAIPETYAGKRVKCPSCAAVLQVPALAEPIDVVEDAPASAFPVAAAPRNMTQPGYGGGGGGGGGNRRSHEVDYEIVGNDMQMVIVELDPGETVIAEAGAMTYMEEGIQFEAKMGDGSAPDTGFFGKMMSVGKRAMTGESLFMTHFTHTGAGKSHVAFAAPYPGKIIPIDLASIPGNDLICQKDAFLCAAFGTQVTIAFNKKIGTGLFGGEGFIMQKLVGDGLAFIHAGGTIIERELHGETLRVDTGCLVAFEPHMEYNIERAGNLKSMFLGGEGLFLATLRGHGRVWLQSLPMRRLSERIVANAGPSGKGEGSILGSLGNLLDGD
ncbi:TIGR00266 family protein [Novipirellula rosea]|uniref:TIGR00266 family protein n=1 Tax=Novipirellula rosea TaxID=1031540 RepID=A0ABP8NWT2_9BACT